ncbi:hypothetical protein FGB62_251g07 [Gracilaria domingensis]|nr:hypothetical protein FGB62_414g02 [Gracilaria domingensis]KAI0557908.1 hypothetical protein FGB62_251g07 [Gracilaria domingensis]
MDVAKREKDYRDINQWMGRVQSVFGSTGRRKYSGDVGDTKGAGAISVSRWSSVLFLSQHFRSTSKYPLRDIHYPGVSRTRGLSDAAFEYKHVTRKRGGTNRPGRRGEGGTDLREWWHQT